MFWTKYQPQIHISYIKLEIKLNHLQKLLNIYKVLRIDHKTLAKEKKRVNNNT